MSESDKKLKLLLFGAVNDKISAFANKVKALHKSKAGPFDICFCVGTFHVPAEGSPDYDALQTLPIPVYIQDALMASGTTTTTSISDDNSNDETITIQTLIEPNIKAFPATKSNIYNISVPQKPQVKLVVASCPRTLRMDDETNVKPLMDKLSHVSYVGCDLLLTSHWPQGIEGLDADSSIESQARLSATYDVAEVALRARARYHMVPCPSKINQFWQSPPFFHLASTTSTHKPQHTGRLIALGSVSADKKVPKEHKFVHALGLVPLHFMDSQEIQQSLGQGVAPCPFTDASYGMDDYAGKKGAASSFSSAIPTTTSTGLSEAQARRILAEGASGQPQRWNLPNHNKRKRTNNTDGNGATESQDAQEMVDPTNTTLFVHGLHKDVSGQLQQASNVTLLQAFHPYGAVKVRKPPNAATTSFAFVEFETHQQAKDCLETLGGETQVGGVTLTLKWGTHNNTNTNKQNPRNRHQNHDPTTHKRPRLTEEEARDSSTLYYRLPNRILTHDFATASEMVRKVMEMTLEDALSEDGNRITAAEEPALQVQVRHAEGQVYGFLDFASHAAASMAMATLTGNTNGGIVQCPEAEKGLQPAADSVVKSETTTSEKQEPNSDEPSNKSGEEMPEADKVQSDNKDSEEKSDSPKDQNQQEKPNDAPSKQDDITPPPKPEESLSADKFEKLWGVALHWAHQKTKDSERSKMEEVIRDADCDFEFRRQHFPPDSRQDCWFCLASEGCEKHLITGVYHQCYAAMPKGPIHKGHVLLIPVAHSSQGAFIMDKSVSQEIQSLQKALRRHAHEVYDMDLFVFERAIQTKGGYHTHVQCVPVPKGLGIKLETTLRAQAKTNHFELREIQSPDLDLSALIGQNDDDDNEQHGGYFYAEVPMPGGPLEYKRFLYQVKQQPQESREDSIRRRPRVPIQFGREVVAAVLGRSELAHWKSCEMKKDEEAKMAGELRKSFEPYYDVNS